MSRPKQLLSATVHLRRGSLEAVDALARERETSRASVLRQAVEEFLRRQGRVPEVAARVVAQPGISMAAPQVAVSEGRRAPEPARKPETYLTCGLCPEDALPIARIEFPAHVAAHRAAFERGLAGRS